MADIFAAVDLAGIATFIGAAGLVIVGAALTLKAITIGKRAINKA